MAKKKQNQIKRISFGNIPVGETKHIVLISEVFHNYFGDKFKDVIVSLRFHKVEGRFIAVDWEPYAREGLLAYVFAEYAQLAFVSEAGELEFIKYDNFRVDVDAQGKMSIARFGTATKVKEALEVYKENHANKITDSSWPQSRCLTDMIKMLDAISAEVKPMTLA